MERVKLICRKINEKSMIESEISELEEKYGYTFHSIIPISSNPMIADMCIILRKLS